MTKKQRNEHFSEKEALVFHAQGKPGKIEIKAKLPKGRGSWPAIWMLGSNIGTIGWPDCGETVSYTHLTLPTIRSV